MARGAVPATNCSSTAGGQWGPASSPLRGQMRAVTIPPGRSICGSRPRIARVITSAHRGPAPVMPETLCIGEPSKLPTHTPTVPSEV